MFHILQDPSFDFMSRRNAFIALSIVLVVVSAVMLGVDGINFGIEFTGGTELQLKYADQPDLRSIRGALKDAGMTNNVVTTIGDPVEHEVYIRLGSTEESAGKDQTQLVLDTLRSAAGVAPGESRSDLNVIDEPTIETLLATAPGLTHDEAVRLATEIVERRKDTAIFHDYDDLSGLADMTPQVMDHLKSISEIGPLALRSQSYIGPTIGKELLKKALLAIVGSLIGMLLYIWVRFQLIWGFAAVVALAHDTLITLGLFALLGKEMSLPVVAAFLTLIGYSVNDTVVVFDRIRENIRNRRAPDLQSTINLSINQTLSRTVITSGLTWVVVAGLYLFGGAALRPFSFVLTVGVIVGTYSSIFIASPILMLWKSKLEVTTGTPAGGGRRARKARSTTA